MSRLLASPTLAATTLILTLGLGCGSSAGGGCGGMRALPATPGPLGLPTNQVIEGGLQARITKPGIDKLTSTIPSLFHSMLDQGFCAANRTQLVNLLVEKVFACSANDCPGGVQGCPAFVYLDSKDRPAQVDPAPPFPPAAGGNEDGKDRILVTLQDSTPTTPPVLTVDASFDVLVPVQGSISGLYSSSCYLYAYDSHLGDDSQDPVHIVANIELGTDPSTGELTLHLSKTNPLRIVNLGLQVNGCGAIGDLLNALVSFVSGTLQSSIGNYIVGLLQPQLDSLLQSFLPKPLGLAGVLDAGSLLSSFDPPKDDNLETFIVPGGYVASSGGGLTLGVMSGMNSDRDETTRDPSVVSEPNLCVPARPAPDLAAQPWMLPLNPARQDFVLSPAGPFSGNPEPMDASGNLEDVAIGISRTFLDLAGFHIYNSGTMCLHVGGSSLPQLNAGTVSVLIGSLGNIIEDRKAPLSLMLRPQTPLTFTVGAGTMDDPLLHIAVSDLRIDFYAWLEERWARLLTVGLDTNIGVNLTITKDPMTMKPAIQPVLIGLEAKNVTVRVSNTDLLQETPASLAALFPTLINVATGAIGGAIKPIVLPSVAGFDLDNLSISRVQTSQDDFVGIFASIMQATTLSLGGWKPHIALPSVQTRAAVASVDVPPQAALEALFDGTASLLDPGARPRVTLDLGADQTGGREVEYAWRIDGGIWRPWTRDAHPVIADDAFLLQGRHTIEVRSRAVGAWATEDTQPQKLTVLIDSMPPELHPAKDPQDPTRLAFNGFDIVSDADKLTYAFTGADGVRTAFAGADGMPLALARAITNGGRQPLDLWAMDEAGNVGHLQADLTSVLGHMDPSADGCSCEIGGAARTPGKLPAILIAVVVAGLALRRRRALAAVLGFGGVLALGLGALGCGSNAGNCSIDDDCAQTPCMTGQVAQCQSHQCVCNSDIPFGAVGRFASMALRGPDAYVAAYNTDYGDLMIGHVRPPGVVPSWDFVDGVPDEGPTNINNSHVRGGIEDKGDDVGRYTSLQMTASNDPVIAYYDLTHGALKFASFGVVRWHSHFVDQGAGTPASGGDDIGRWASMSIGPDGRPLIAYTATQTTGTQSGMPEGQLRVAQANVPNPQSSGDWTITIVDARPLPAASMSDMGADVLLPDGIGLMPALARKPDGTPGLAYYDHTRGNLRYVEYLPGQGKWSSPVILDGEAADGTDTGDTGMYPSLAYDQSSLGHISYVDASHDSLLYLDTMTRKPEVVDNGYRSADENTLDGLPSPVWHLVGDSSSIQTQSGVVVIAYQDATVEQLRYAQKGMDGKWTLANVAGHATPFAGSYGFYANLRMSGPKAVISSYGINQQTDSRNFYVEVFAVDLGLIM
jgi:MYXO-CTERM domain-containing protein